jgi:LPS export ABC transporter protein LptC
MKKALVAAGIALVLVVVVLAWRGGSAGGPPAAAVAAPPLPPTGGRIENFRYTRTTGGRTEWVLDAEAAEFFGDKARAVFENGRMEFTTKEGRVLRLSGRRGTFHTDTQDVEIDGNVIAGSNDGYRLLTETLRYDAGKNEVTTADPLLFFGDRLNVRGQGMKIEVDAQRVTLGGPVEALLWNLPDQAPAKVSD